MQTKPKKCKGTGRVKHIQGCGKLVYEREFGLCHQCRNKWLASNDPEAQEYLLKRLIPRAKKKVETDKKELRQKQKASIKYSVDGYRAKVVQPKINKIARLIDHNLFCISGGGGGKLSGGHFIDVGSNRTTALNLHNIHRQSFYSNHHKSGDKLNYRLGLIKEYGNDYLEFIESLKGTPAIKLSMDMLEELSKKCDKVIRDFEIRLYNPKERIQKRNEINLELGIYSEKFAVYSIT